MTVRITCRNPDRWSPRLQRLRGRGGFREIKKLTLMRTVTGPEFSQQRSGFTHTLTCLPGIHARHHAFVFIRISPPRNPQLKPPVRHQISHGSFTRQSDRMPERSDDGSRTQLYIFSMPGKIGDGDERIRRNGKFHTMMFTRPDRPHPAFICQGTQ